MIFTEATNTPMSINQTATITISNNDSDIINSSSKSSDLHSFELKKFDLKNINQKSGGKNPEKPANLNFTVPSRENEDQATQKMLQEVQTSLKRIEQHLESSISSSCRTSKSSIVYNACNEPHITTCENLGISRADGEPDVDVNLDGSSAYADSKDDCKGQRLR